MRRTLRPLAALAMITLLSAGCSNAPLVVPPPTPMPAPASPAPVLGRALSPPGLLSPAARRLPASREPGAGRVLLTAADGYIADGEGLSPFATDYPAVRNLVPELLVAVQHASTDAARDGVALIITSGWRSVRYQQSLLDAAIVQYGSRAEARRWVNTPERSTHVTGKAVDIGPPAADLWLRRHGNRYGLCQIYANEMWHYELATEPGGICRRPVADASAG
jgi:zinc D-Ala-D-Ala carboxypeptidase